MVVDENLIQANVSPAEQRNVFDLYSLKGRVAFLTGGARGLGRSIAQGFAEAGATTVLAGRDLEACRVAAEELAAETGAESVGVAIDVTRAESVERAFSEVVDRYHRLDVLVNCAGVNLRRTLEECPVEDYQLVVDVNLVGTWLCCRQAGRLMRPARSGSVINLGSALSAVGLPGRSPYCSAKAGVVGLTKAIALEWAGTGLRCNALCPGPFLTDMNFPLLDQPERAREVIGRTALNRWGGLIEIRGPALFLASDASSYVTGAALFVDGGWTAQ